MTSLRASHDPTALDQYNKTFNGHIYQPDEQCHHYRNGSSYVCRVSLKSINNENSNCTRSSQCQNVQKIIVQINLRIEKYTIILQCQLQRITEYEKSLRIPKG
jgi:hypothetical protein